LLTGGNFKTKGIGLNLALDVVNIEQGTRNDEMVDLLYYS